MTREEILEFARSNPVFSLATIDGDRPRVRLMMLALIDQGELVFSTGRDKAVNKQMMANPAVELCFYNADQGRQVRIEGRVEAADDEDLKRQIVEKFEFLKPVVQEHGYDVLATYRLKNARATAWTMETNFEPKQYTAL